MRYRTVVFAACVLASAAHAEVCTPGDLQGDYGFLLTGSTSIGSATRPVAAIGRLSLDGSGKLSGSSSVAFTGLLLGNPVTGAYEAHTDCSVEWKLQDDSGTFQHFAGTMSAGGNRVVFRQTDPGGAPNGIMLRTAGDCTDASFQGPFQLTISGSTVDVNSGIASGRVSVTGILQADGGGNLTFAAEPDAPAAFAGTYDFDDGCIVRLGLELPAGGDETAEMNFRAVLAADGRQVLGIQTDPGAVASIRLVSR